MIIKSNKTVHAKLLARHLMTSEAEECNMALSVLVKYLTLDQEILTMKSIRLNSSSDIDSLIEILGRLTIYRSFINSLMQHRTEGNKALLSQSQEEFKLLRNALLTTLSVTWDQKG